MTELWHGLVTLTLAQSGAVIGLMLLRRPLLAWAGATARWQAWLLVPGVVAAALAAVAVPLPATHWQVILPDAGRATAARSSVTAFSAITPVADATPVWLAPALGLWAFGVAGVAGALVVRQRAASAGGTVALVGLWRPRVQLPPQFRQRFTAAQCRLVLLHERVHAERGDTRWLALAWTLLALQWFNPLAWWATGRLRVDMELACDAEVLRRRPGQLATYRAALLADAGLSHGAPLATPFVLHPLVERIAMLPQHRSLPARRALVALAALAASAWVYAAQPAPTVAKAPVQDGYSKLRLDVQVSVNGKAEPAQLALHTFNEQRVMPFEGAGVRLLVSGAPHRDPAVANGEEVLMLRLEVIDVATGAVHKPRLATKDGVPARIEFGNEGERIVRIDVLPRVVRTRLHDSTGALAELQRDIAAGKAPAVSVRP